MARSHARMTLAAPVLPRSIHLDSNNRFPLPAQVCDLLARWMPAFPVDFRRTAAFLLGILDARWPRFDQTTALDRPHPPSSPTLKGILMSAATQVRRPLASGSAQKTSTQVTAWVAKSAKQAIVQESIDLGPLGAEEVEIAVEHCGLCHSDLSVFNNDWGNSQYPAVLGHEIVGHITALGSSTKRLKIGQRVGVGWFSRSDMCCRQCLSGNHHLCPNVQATIIGHRGGLASHVRAHWAWTFRLPEKLNFADAGPLLCGGITVFNPLAMYGRPTDRVGIIGIGGLGHMAVKFTAAYGCDVTAFTANESKFDEARGFGAVK